MKFQIVSDLHLEFIQKFNSKWENYLTPSAPYLVLLGDISPLRNKAYYIWLQKISPLYEKIFYVYGNHEWYDTKHNCVMSQSKEKFETFVKENIPNLIILDNTTYDIERYRIIGGTMWGFINPNQQDIVKNRMNDYNQIYTESGKLTVTQTNDMHVKFKEFLMLELIVAEYQKKTAIVFTHHAPLIDKRCIDEKHWGDPCNQAYLTDMSEFMTDEYTIKLWAFGHTHHCADFMYNDVRIYSNPKGYDRHEQTGYDKRKVVEVD